MRFIKYTGLAIVLSVLSACSSVDVNTDYSKSTNFAELKTYTWFTVEAKEKAANSDSYGVVEVSPITDARIRAAIKKELGNNDIKEAMGQGDFNLTYSVLTKDEVDIRTYNTYGGYSSGWGYRGGYGYGGYGGYGMGVGTSDTVVKEYLKGTLVIDFVDPVTNQLVWRGLGSKRLPNSSSADEKDELVQEVVESILKNFPPE